MTCIRSTEARRRERMVATAAAGDRTATEELLTLVRPLLVAYCTARVADPSGVDPVVAQVVDDVRAALPGLAGRRTPFPGWVYGLAARRVSGANAGFEGGRVETLRPQARKVLALRRAGRGFDEIARTIFLSQGTVRSIFHLAVKHLQRLSSLERAEVLVAIRAEAPVVRGSGSGDLEDDTGSLDLVAARRELAADARASHDPEPGLARALASLPDEDHDTLEGTRSLGPAMAPASPQHGGPELRSRFPAPPDRAASRVDRARFRAGWLSGRHDL